MARTVYCTYCSTIGLSMPSRFSSRVRVTLCGPDCPSIMRSTMLPGMKRSIATTRNRTSSIVGTMASSRRTMYWLIPRPP